MQLKSWIFSAAITAIAAVASSVSAMDLPPQVFEGQEASPLSIGQGWYIRGDFGASYKASMGTPTERSYSAGTYSTNSFDQGRLSADFDYGVGAGYQFTDYFRTDVTVDYATGKYKGQSQWRSPCTTASGAATTSCRYESQTYGALGLMANGYVDLGTYWGLTPYVGAGAGLTYLQWNGVSQYYRCTGSAVDCGGVNRDSGTLPGADSWRMTYALMAGVSYDLTQRTKFDLGYRYSRISSGDMFGFSNYEEALGAFGAKGRDKPISRHEIRAGIRLTSW